jgi:predicted nuclease with TOPRIM domain
MACNCTGRCLITGYCEAAQAIPGAVRIETAGFMRPVEKPVLKSEWDLMQDKVNQLSAENKKLKEENEKLKFENGEIGQLNEIIEAKDRELEHIYQLNYKLGDKVRALQTENAQLKAKIEQLSGISGQLKVLSVDDAVKLNQIICPRIKELESQLERTSQFYKELQQENAQLKAQLQNRDKVSQDIFNNHNMMPDHAREIVGETERKPHKCPVCRGIIGICKIYEQVSDEVKSLGIAKQDEQGIWYIPCIPCNGTGIVWEPQ